MVPTTPVNIATTPRDRERIKNVQQKLQLHNSNDNNNLKVANTKQLRKLTKKNTNEIGCGVDFSSPDDEYSSSFVSK